MKARSFYSWGIDGDFIVIIDQGGTLSVTNDAEAVIEYLTRQGVDVDSKRVIYRDTEGQWDEMLTVDGKFRGFRILGVRTLAEAKAKWSRP